MDRSLSGPGAGGALQLLSESVRLAGELVADARSVVVLTGAGISTDSGIPDFRGPNGLWTTGGPRQGPPGAEEYLRDPAVRRRSWAGRLDAPVWSATPNDGHRSLVALERRGALELLITQNADGLHRMVGHGDDLVVELHGSVRTTICLRCGATVPTTSVIERVRAGELDPHCLEPAGSERCGGVLRISTVGFGQPLDAEQLRRCFAAVARCELLLAVGSTLRVDPVASLVPFARDAGAAVVIVNLEPTRHDACADVVVRGSISAVLPQLVA